MNTLNLSREGAELLKGALEREIQSTEICRLFAATLNVNYGKKDAAKDAEKLDGLKLLLDSVEEIIYNYSRSE